MVKSGAWRPCDSSLLRMPNTVTVEISYQPPQDVPETILTKLILWWDGGDLAEFLIQTEGLEDLPSPRGHAYACTNFGEIVSSFVY